MPLPLPMDHRTRCYRCFRPGQLCLCDTLPEVVTKTRLVVLQHPRERRHAFNTARLVDLALPTAERVVVPRGGNGHRCPEIAADRAAILYPHDRAADLADLPRAELPSTLFLIDGTWGQARRIYNDNAWLHRLPHFRLHPSEPSSYRIRREPQRDYVSTLEAAVAALSILEPDTRGLDGLRAAFDRMIDTQLDVLDRAERHGRRRRPRDRSPRRVPRQLLREDAVVVYAEPAAAPVFVRLADGVPVGLRDLPHDVPVAAWSQRTLRQLAPWLQDRSTVCLRTTYSNVRGAAAGYLEDALERHGLTPQPLPLPGRIGQRLANACAMARWLAARGRTEAAGALSDRAVCSGVDS
jgi:DTW domain-containing protein YfiP